MNDAFEYFKSADPRLYAVSQLISPIEPLAPSDNHLAKLVESIISQQLSEKAGDTIVKRVYTLFPEQKITVDAVLSVPDQAYRDAGVSWSKAAYIKNIARAQADGHVDFSSLASMGDEEVIAMLTQIKGIGRWTAEMFLMFSLARPDIFSAGDLGLKRAITRIYGPEKTRNTSALVSHARQWSPYRSTASRVLWRSLTVDVSDI